ncbi:MAG: hypothetical protein V4773_28920 [Verrucomicrobiota bacterium]
MARSLPRRIWLVVKSLVLLAVCVLVFQVVAPQLRSTEHFVPVGNEPRVHYEPGAENAAHTIAQALPAAIAAVEAGHFRPFSQPVVVHVCATTESFDRYAFGVQGAGGYVYAGRLFISPKPVNTAERLPRLVTHELSHLHLEQAAGMFWMASAVPGWFKEGLATHVARGGGAEAVSEAEARAAIATGRVFQRDASGSILFPQTGQRDGLPAHLFYRESALFVAFLARAAPTGSFEQLLLALQDRTDFSDAIQKSYARDLPTLWSEFTAEVALTK